MHEFFLLYKCNKKGDFKSPFSLLGENYTHKTSSPTSATLKKS